MRFPISTFVLAASVALWLAGCGDTPAPAPAPPKPDVKPVDKPADDHADHKDEHKDGHAHGAGPHGGALLDWGGGKYHVEFTVDHDKKEATVFILGGDEKTAAPIKATDGKLTLDIKDPAFEVELKAVPQEGDPEGTSSRFVGTDDKLGVVQEFAGTISGEVEGTPYTGDFKEEPPAKE